MLAVNQGVRDGGGEGVVVSDLGLRRTLRISRRAGVRVTPTPRVGGCVALGVGYVGSVARWVLRRSFA